MGCGIGEGRAIRNGRVVGVPFAGPPVGKQQSATPRGALFLGGDWTRWVYLVHGDTGSGTPHEM